MGYDTNGNLTSDGSNTFVYDVENRLVTRSGGASATLRYDPLGRLYEVTGSSGTRRFLYDGSDLVAEYNTAGTLLRRYVHGLGAGDDPLVWYEGSGLSDRRYLYTDERGSIVAVTNGAGSALAINKYDEYGIPAAGNLGAFQYTGQVWLPELGMYHYKARMYSPTLGRFMQTDPIGYGDGMNMYAYVRNDPMNGVDPTGLTCWNEGKQELQYLTGEDCLRAGYGWLTRAVGGELDGRDILLKHGPTSTKGGHYNYSGTWVPNASYQHPREGTASYATDMMSLTFNTNSGDAQQSVRNQIRSDICEVGQAIQTIGDWGGRGSAALIGGGLVAAPFTGGASLSISAAGGKGLMLSGYVSAGGQFVQDLASGTDFGTTAVRLYVGTVGGGQAARNMT